MKRSLPLVLVLAAVLLGIAPLTASAAMPANYAVLKAGVYSPNSDDLDGFDTGFNGEIAFGHYLLPNVALELGIGYFVTEADAVLGTTSANVEIKTYPITLSGKFFLPMGQFEPYAEAGIGAYIVKAEASIFDPTFALSGSDDDTTLGFFLGLGANFNITPNIFAGVEGRYLWAEPSFGGVDIKIDGFTATANLGFRF